MVGIAGGFDTLNEFYDQISLFSGETNEASKTKESVKVLTIHSSKGLEWKYVFLPGWVAGKLPMSCFSGEKPED